MSSLAVPDIISIVGTSYFQPIADLIERMLQHEPVADNSSELVILRMATPRQRPSY